MDKHRFQRFIDRDGSCYATGVPGETLVPQHRLGGMGGNRPEQPSAIIVFDGVMNGLIESDFWWQRQAYANGWKLRGENPATSPVWHVRRGWLMLDDEFGVRAATPEEITAWKAHVLLSEKYERKGRRR